MNKLLFLKTDKRAKEEGKVAIIDDDGHIRIKACKEKIYCVNRPFFSWFTSRLSKSNDEGPA